MRHFSTLALATLVALTSCDSISLGSSNEARQAAADFADAYFNYDFATALQHATPESRQWIEFFASNVHEADLDMIRQTDEGTEVEVVDIDFDSNDSTATATVEVANYLQLAIGKTGEIVDKGVFRLPLVKRDGTWVVRMENLPRSGTK